MGNSAKVDQKGRLKIPVTLLSMFDRFGSEFYITSEDGDSVRIYPMPVWNQVEEKLKRSSSYKRSNKNLLARAKYFGSAVTADKQGRILIPIGLRKSAQMFGDVDILDYLPYLEVWNHARFLKKLRSNPTTVQEEQRLTNFVTSLKLPWALQSKKRTEKEVAFGDARRFGNHRRLPGRSSRNAIGVLPEPASRAERANMN